MRVTKVASALTLTVVFAAAIAAAPQAPKPAPPAPAKASDQKPAATKPAAKPAAPKAMTEAVKPADLPKAITDAVMKDHPKGTITAASKVTKGSDVTYKVTVKDDKKVLPAMSFTADGKMVMKKK